VTSLAGKRILVTGAGSGIGRAAARRFASLGAELILVGRRGDALRETLPQVSCRELDHSDDASVGEFSKECPELDGMLLAAGQLITGSVETTATLDFDRMVNANLRGPWLICHHLGSRLRAGASVVLVGSNIGIRALPDSAAYSISKAGVHMLARVLALEWASRQIRCNAIAPGPVHTAMVEARLAASREVLSSLASVNPLHRLGTEAEVAALAAHLLSDESTWTTGTLIPIDGGATAVF
jgi:2-keto-3-deoxy-L-fuconate dehydrogenase